MDVLSIVPEEQSGTVLERAGEGSKLHKKYGVFIQPMNSIITLPENYAERGQELLWATTRSFDCSGSIHMILRCLSWNGTPR